ncbi:MAG TPA: anhydro-N-acetylmuramic acid kinase [Chromatiales bacterium]|nr:anhydro-N-acetylmuramic acid kinase [Chromatiales bacterium]
MQTELFIGLISGTSMDGIDAALVRFDDRRCELLASRCTAYPDALHSRLMAAADDPSACGLPEFGMFQAELSEAFAQAAVELITASGHRRDDIAAIGSHGQTLLHSPDGAAAFSLQAGDPGRIAVLTGIPTVGDFRNADIALGGQGAPLVPAFHRWLFAQPGETRAVLNLGGIANLTILPATGEIRGFDTGPANTLLDRWIRRHHNQPFDENGAWAAGGKVDEALLEQLLADPYFSRAAPRSTGPEYFSLDWLDGQLQTFGQDIAAQDVQATVAELTARSVADALHAFAPLQAVAVCGGGAHNTDLLDRLQRLLEGVQLDTTDAWGLPADQVEAVAFAWLARERLAGRPTALPSVTGARAGVPLGGLYLPGMDAL